MSTTQYIRYPGSGGTTIAQYANFAAFPATAASGSLAIALDTDLLYIYDSGLASWKLVGGGISAVGTFDSQAPSAKGLVLSGDTLYAQSASVSNPGMVNAVAQSFAGKKTLTQGLNLTPIAGPYSVTGDIGFDSGNNDKLTVYNGKASVPVNAVVSVKEWGAKGDGSTDDTVKLQAAYNSLTAGQSLFYPAGTYVTSDIITVPTSGILSFGEGASSVIKVTAAIAEAFYINGLANVQFSNLKFLGHETTANGRACIVFDTGCSGFYVGNCIFSGPSDGTGFNIGINALQATWGIVENSYFERIVGATSGNGYGILVSNNSKWVSVNNSTMDFTQSATQGGRHGIYFSSGSSYCEAIGNNIKNSSLEGISLNSTTGQNAQIACRIIGNHIESTGGSGIFSNGNQKGHVISDNTIEGCATNGITLQCETSGSFFLPVNHTISANTILSCGQYGILISGGSQNNIVSNTIRDVSTSSTQTYSGITISDNSETAQGAGDRNSVTGNYIIQTSAAGTQMRSGIQIISSATNTFIGGDNNVVNQNIFNSQFENVSTSTIFGQNWAADGSTRFTLSIASLSSTPFTNNRVLTVDTQNASRTLAMAGNATISGTNSGDVTLAAVGSTPSANGASLSAQVLTLQPADATHPGLITAAAQTVAGAKTFSGDFAVTSVTDATPTGAGALTTLGGLNVAKITALGGGSIYFANDSAFPASTTWDSAVSIQRTNGSGTAPFDQSGSLVYRTRLSTTAGRSSHWFYTGSPAALVMHLDETQNAIFPGTLKSTLATVSTSSSTGGAIFSGGIGVALDSVFGAKVTVGGNATILGVAVVENHGLYVGNSAGNADTRAFSRMGFGFPGDLSGAATNYGLWIDPAPLRTSTTQWSMLYTYINGTSGTASTTAQMNGIFLDVTNFQNSTATRANQLLIAQPTGGTNNAAITDDTGNTYTGNWFINQVGTAASKFIGTINFANTTAAWKTASGNEATGSGVALFGANCPATTLTAPYTWIKAQSSDGSTVYYPAWK